MHRLLDNVLGSDWRDVGKKAVAAGVLMLLGGVIVDGGIATDLTVWHEAARTALGAVATVIVLALSPNPE